MASAFIVPVASVHSSHCQYLYCIYYHLIMLTHTELLTRQMFGEKMLDQCREIPTRLLASIFPVLALLLGFCWCFLFFSISLDALRREKIRTWGEERENGSRLSSEELLGLRAEAGFLGVVQLMLSLSSFGRDPL